MAAGGSGAAGVGCAHSHLALTLLPPTLTLSTASTGLSGDNVRLVLPGVKFTLTPAPALTASGPAPVAVAVAATVETLSLGAAVDAAGVKVSADVLPANALFLLSSGLAVMLMIQHAIAAVSTGAANMVRSMLSKGNTACISTTATHEDASPMLPQQTGAHHALDGVSALTITCLGLDAALYLKTSPVVEARLRWQGGRLNFSRQVPVYSSAFTAVIESLPLAATLSTVSPISQTTKAARVPAETHAEPQTKNEEKSLPTKSSNAAVTYSSTRCAPASSSRALFSLTWKPIQVPALTDAAASPPSPPTVFRALCRFQPVARLPSRAATSVSPLLAHLDVGARLGAVAATADIFAATSTLAAVAPTVANALTALTAAAAALWGETPVLSTSSPASPSTASAPAAAVLQQLLDQEVKARVVFGGLSVALGPLPIANVLSDPQRRARLPGSVMQLTVGAGTVRFDTARSPWRSRPTDAVRTADAPSASVSPSSHPPSHPQSEQSSPSAEPEVRGLFGLIWEDTMNLSVTGSGPSALTEGPVLTIALIDAPDVAAQQPRITPLLSPVTVALRSLRSARIMSDNSACVDSSHSLRLTLCPASAASGLRSRISLSIPSRLFGAITGLITSVPLAAAQIVPAIAFFGTVAPRTSRSFT